MNNRKRFGFHALFALLVVAGLSSCKQKDDPGPAANNVKFEFNNIVGNEALQLSSASSLNKKWYTNPDGDSFTVSMYKYYISNIVLNKADGTKFVEPESYHLVNQENPDSRKFTIANVPNGEYVSVTFLIGVDSARNNSGAQTGALSVDSAMFWGWDTGYIMAKMEGSAPTATSTDKKFIYHTGGFGYNGGINVLRKVTLMFPNKAIVSGGNIPNVHVFSNVLEWFKTPNTITFKDFTNVMSGKGLISIADNYADMFVVDHIDN